LMVDFHQEDGHQILMRINGGINKSKQEFLLELQDRNHLKLSEILQ